MLRVALPYENWQVRAHLRKPPVPTKGGCTQCPSCRLQNRADRRFCHATGTKCDFHRIAIRVTVDPRGRVAQYRRGTGECSIDRPQMCAPIRIIAMHYSLPQGVPERGRCAVPAGRNTPCALPESGAAQILARSAGSYGGYCVKLDFNTLCCCHTDRVPASFGYMDTGRPTVDGGKPSLPARVAAGHKRVGDESRSRAPRLGASKRDDRVAFAVSWHSFIGTGHAATRVCLSRCR